MSEDLTGWLRRIQDGDAAAWERVARLVYDDLRQIARQRLRSERDHHTLGTTALVHEAFLRLARQHGLPAESRTQFLAAASNTMRRVLVDYARARHRFKRGGGVAPVPLEGAAEIMTEAVADEILALEEALERLAKAEPRAARVVECRFFSGLTLEEIAEQLKLSEKTIRRDWLLARAWLRREVARGLELPE
jgi:RNA polymerase sigma factor (TIGR02999 family)